MLAPIFGTTRYLPVPPLQRTRYLPAPNPTIRAPAKLNHACSQTQQLAPKLNKSCSCCKTLLVDVPSTTLHRWFEQISFTHFTFDSLTFVLGGVGTRDPAHSKELDVGSNARGMPLGERAAWACGG